MPMFWRYIILLAHNSVSSKIVLNCYLLVNKGCHYCSRYCEVANVTCCRINDGQRDSFAIEWLSVQIWFWWWLGFHFLRNRWKLNIFVDEFLILLKRNVFYSLMISIARHIYYLTVEALQCCALPVFHSLSVHIALV